ncbi:MAG: energy transducer TonB [Woeseiaceae bacterium]
MLSLTLFFVWLAAASDTDVVELQEKLEAVISSSRQLSPAKQIERGVPRYPRSELRKGTQAWVNVAYCIDESGSPQNVSVVDSIGSSKFERAAVDAVNKWRFEPARIDGEPSWQSRNQTIITFAIEQGNEGARRSFIKEFRKIGNLIDHDKLDDADKRFKRVLDTYELSLYELSKLWAQRVRYEGKRGDMHKLDMALHRATASKGEWIDKKSYVRLLKLRTQVEIGIGKYHGARRTFRELIEAAGEDSEEVVALQPTMDRLQAMIAGNEVLKISAEVRSRNECHYCNDSWYFSPVRNDFTINNIAGNLSSIEMRCDHKRFESAVADLVEWHIPDDWGRCYVQVYGEPGTTFDVLMLPKI